MTCAVYTDVHMKSMTKGLQLQAKPSRRFFLKGSSIESLNACNIVSCQNVHMLPVDVRDQLLQ